MSDEVERKRKFSGFTRHASSLINRLHITGYPPNSMSPLQVCYYPVSQTAIEDSFRGIYLEPLTR